MLPLPVPHVNRLTPYEWEASAAEVAAEAGLDAREVVRFDTNTAPWPPVAWEETVLELPRLPVNEYPHPSNEPLRSALSARLQLTPERVVVTNGADEALALTASVFLGPGRRAVTLTPTFSMFRVVTEVVGAELVSVPLDDDWQVAREPLLDAVREDAVSVVWLCSPNNPTGQLLSAALVEAVAEAAPRALVVLDEAYHEIAGVTLAPLLADFPNLLLVRTFSKGYGLAGARVGYAAGDPSIVALLDAVRLPQNLSAFGIAAAYAALHDQAGLEARVAAIRDERARLQTALVERGWQVVPSHANFLLARPPVPAGELGHWLQGAGLVARTYPHNPRLTSYLRLTVRSPEENARLLARLDSFPGQPQTAGPGST